MPSEPIATFWFVFALSGTYKRLGPASSELMSLPRMIFSRCSQHLDKKSKTVWRMPEKGGIVYVCVCVFVGAYISLSVRAWSCVKWCHWVIGCSLAVLKPKGIGQASIQTGWPREVGWYGCLFCYSQSHCNTISPAFIFSSPIVPFCSLLIPLSFWMAWLNMLFKLPQPSPSL